MKKFSDFIKEITSNPSTLEEALITFGGKTYPRFGNIVIMAGGAGCFDGETLVKTETGYKKIVDVAAGDMVYTINEDTKEIELKAVQELVVFEKDDLIENLLEIVTEEGETIICTESHPFYVNGEWVKAKDLKVSSKRVIDSDRKVYDLSMEGNHNYMITKSDIIVHNSGKGFVKDKLLGIEGMTFDVDELKLLSTKIPSIINKVEKETGIDLRDFDVSKNKYALKDPQKVAELHNVIANVLELDRAKLKGIVNAILMAPADRKPNIIFDVTMKDMRQFNKYTKQFQDYGYDKKNIHIVWVINDVKIAKEQNEARARTVPIEILMQTHAGTALTMKEVVGMGNEVRNYLDGDIVFAFNKVKVDSSLVKSGRGGEYVADANYVYVKRAGKPVDQKALTKDLMTKISYYVPEAAYAKEVADVIIKNTQKVWIPK